MKNTTWLLVLIIIIVVAGGIYAWQAQAPTAPMTSIEPTVTQTAATSTSINQPVQQVPDSTPNGSDSIQATLEDEATIAISDTGFEPKSVTIPVNGTVTFVNNGQAPHWPASDPHPTHTNLAGFDAEHALQTGESYTFTFTKAGTWGFHDHLNARLTGQVIVQ